MRDPSLALRDFMRLNGHFPFEPLLRLLPKSPKTGYGCQSGVILDISNLIRTLEICVGLSYSFLEALGQEECHVTLRMLILTSRLLKEPFNRTIDVFPYL